MLIDSIVELAQSLSRFSEKCTEGSLPLLSEFGAVTGNLISAPVPINQLDTVASQLFSELVKLIPLMFALHLRLTGLLLLLLW